MTKYIILLVLALTAIQGLNADTLLKRGIFDNFINSTKSQIDEAKQLAKSIAELIDQQVKQEEQKTTDRISQATNQFGKHSPFLFADIADLIQQEINNLGSSALAQFGKRSPSFFTDLEDRIQQEIDNLGSSALAQFGKRSPSLFTDLEDLIQQEIDKLGSSAFAQFGKRSPLIFDQILNRNSSSNHSFISEFINKTKEDAEHGQKKMQEFLHERKQKFEEYFKKTSQHGQNTTETSKRSITIDSGLAVLNILRSKLETIVQDITKYLESANSTSFIDDLKNVSSDIVGTRFNFTEIRDDVSECVSAEENNVTAELEQARTEQDAIYAKDKTAAEPFLKNVSVTAPKVANLVFAASVNASTCGQNYFCLAIVAFNVYNQAVVLEPEVAQEIQDGVALAKTLAADAKTIKEQIVAPAFSEMKAIAEETISCIEGKITA